MMSDNSLAQDTQTVDVSSSETHYQVQCADIRLLTSELLPLDVVKEVDSSSRFVFKIKVFVQDDTALAHLHVDVVAVNSETSSPLHGYELRFVIAGVFVAEDAIPPEALGDFARMYSLSILWPYAREYTSDQLRRAGLAFESLPIINPQVVTEKLIEGGLVEVQVISNEK